MADIHSEIQTGIINYLLVHPDASASIQRISNHWLTNEKYSHNLDQVQTAIDDLLAQGQVHKRPGTDIYTL